MSGPQIIAFTGLKGSGKDTAADFLVRECGFAHVKMADGLKAMLRTLLLWRGMPEDQVDRWIDGDCKEEPCPALNFRTPRHAMMSLGAEWGRTLMSDTLWVDAARDRIRQFDKVVISDIRYPNEARMVRDMGGALYRIVRPGLPAPDAHSSECQIPSLPVVAEILNDAPSAFEFKNRTVAGSFGGLVTPRLL